MHIPTFPDGKASRLAGTALLVTAAMFLPWPRTARSLPPAPFDVVIIEVDGHLTERVFADFNGDGLDDLLLVSGREVRLHLQRPTTDTGGSRKNSWSAAQDQKLLFHPKTIMFDVANLDRHGGAELVTLAEDGIFYQVWEEGQLSQRRNRLVATTQVGLERPTRSEVRWKDVLRDLDGNGADDLLIPAAGGFEVWRNVGKQGEPIHMAGPLMLPTPMGSFIRLGSERPSSRVTHAFWYPEPTPGNFVAADSDDVVIPHENAVLIYDGGGRYADGPGMKIDLADVRQHKQKKREGLIDLDRSLPTRVIDVNGDQILDLVSTHIGDGTTYIYLGGKGRETTAYEQPDRVVRSGGICFLTHFQDLDGDGKSDLILARTDPLGALHLLSILITREVTVDALVFFGRSDGRWPSEPDTVREVDIPILMRGRSQKEGMDFGTNIVISMEADLDGDGRCDLVSNLDHTHLALYPMQADRSFAEDASQEITIPSTEDFRYIDTRPFDLNRDGRSDLVLAYHSWENDRDRLVLIVSR